MDIHQLSKQLEQPQPPFEQWQPQFCGDIDITIESDGRWFYAGSPIHRMPLVKLFAKVLCYQQQEYFLITPSEKVRIKVVDAPFVITSWQQRATAQGEAIIFTTNLEQQYVLSTQYPLQLAAAEQLAPLYLQLERGLQAKIHRNVYYQLIEVAQQLSDKPQQNWYLSSAGQAFLFAQE